jgi:hypothetical protein
LIEAAASLKSFRPKDEPPGDPPIGGNPSNRWVDFHGEKRSNATHQSTTDPDARLCRKGPGKEAKLSYMGQALMENRHGLLVDFQITTATGTAERDVVPRLIEEARLRGFHPRTLGADKGYDTQECVAQLRAKKVTPHVAQNTTKGRRSAIDGRTTGRPGYPISQRKRKCIEEIFGWSWVDLGSSLPRPPGRSGRAQFGHPAPQITGSLPDARSNARRGLAVTGVPATSAQTAPTSIFVAGIAD